MRLPTRPLLLLAVAVAMAVAAAVVATRSTPPARPPSGPRPGDPVQPFEQVADHLYLVRGAGGNTAVFVTATAVVVVDPKFAASWADVQAQVHRITDRPVTHVVLTHYHADHAGALALLPSEVEIVAQAQAIRRATEFGWLTRASGEAPRVRTYTDRLTLFAGDDAVTLIALGPAHTDGDTLVIFEKARVMHAGDVFPGKVAPIINLEGGGNGVGFAAALAGAAGDLTGVDRVITGHGPVLTWADFQTFADFMQMLVAYVRAEMHFMSDKNTVFRAIRVPDRYTGYDLSRMFNTLDEIDRSIRPRWQRIF